MLMSLLRATVRFSDQRRVCSLARKAELARQSRRRKKMYITDLENKVKKLGIKIEELQQKQARQKTVPKLIVGLV